MPKSGPNEQSIKGKLIGNSASQKPGFGNSLPASRSLGGARQSGGFHIIFKGPGLGFSRISHHFQRPRPWFFKDFTSFSSAPALDFQGFLVIFKGPGLEFSRISRNFQGPRLWIFKDFTSFSRAPCLSKARFWQLNARF